MSGINKQQYKTVMKYLIKYHRVMTYIKANKGGRRRRHKKIKNLATKTLSGAIGGCSKVQNNSSTDWETTEVISVHGSSSESTSEVEDSTSTSTSTNTLDRLVNESPEEEDSSTTGDISELMYDDNVSETDSCMIVDGFTTKNVNETMFNEEEGFTTENDNETMVNEEEGFTTENVNETMFNEEKGFTIENDTETMFNEEEGFTTEDDNETMFNEEEGFTTENVNETMFIEEEGFTTENDNETMFNEEEGLTTENVNETMFNEEENHQPSTSKNDISDISDIADTSDEDEDSYELFKVDYNYLVLLKHSQKIKVFGFCNIKVLFGKVDILGCILTTTSQEQAMYSPRSTALLTLKNISDFCDQTEPIKTLVPLLVQKPQFENISIRKDTSVVMFSRRNDPNLQVIEDHLSQKILPKRTDYPCVNIEPEGMWNTISIPEEWSQAVTNITRQSRTFICGGKGVGKSTFLRYAVNCLLQKYEKVHVIDLDPGQSEFTVPGSISLSTITQPLIGVNYTHLKQPKRSILCDINISQDPHKYVECVSHLMKLEKEEEMQNFPTLINYAGYTRDPAFHLAASTIMITQPTEIVVIYSKNNTKNFKTEMTADAIIEHAQLFCRSLDTNFDVKIIKLPSVTGDFTGWTLQPRQMREMAILAYFGQRIDEHMKCLHDHRVQMFWSDMERVSITDRNNVPVPKETINANLVGLCRLINTEPPIFECFGWGIVRAAKEPLIKVPLIFPVNEFLLEKVTHLVASCIFLPPSVYMNNLCLHGRLPFVMAGGLTELAQLSKRSHRPHKRRQTK